MATSLNKLSPANRRNSGIDTRRLSTTDLQRLATAKQRPNDNEMNKMWSNSAGKSIGLVPGRNTIGPLLLVGLAPTFVILMFQTLTQFDGSVALLYQQLKLNGFIAGVYQLWPTCRDLSTWQLIGTFLAVQLTLMRIVPGRTFTGPVTPSGHIPVYKGNGMQCYAATILLFAGGIHWGYFSGGLIYDHLGRILASMNIFALLFCSVLYIKGKFFPSTDDSGSTGNLIFDFYWGTELYPRILGWDVKQFTNCRCGMMFWALAIISFALKQKELQGHFSYAMMVNVILQLVYITKFYWWESGYMSSIDIQHDRAGFYICWGVLVFLPMVYTSHSAYLVAKQDDIILPVALALLVAGLFCVYVNFDVDWQRQHFRATKGNCKVWGADPFFIEAKYKTEKGEVKSSLLLGSGWWGVSRHFHYIPEVLASACWTIPVWTPYLLPYFYIPYLTLLLLDRAVRDDARCRSKYGKSWDVYCKKVEYLVIPYIF